MDSLFTWLLSLILFALPWVGMCCSCNDKTISVDESALPKCRFYQRDSNGDALIPITSTDADRYRIGSGPWISYDGQSITLPTGVHSVEFGRKDCANKSLIIDDLRVGIVVLDTGQSNNSGGKLANQVYTGTGDSLQISFNGVCSEPRDPTHEATPGSVWPIVQSQVDTQCNIPTMFIHCSVSGTRIAQWVNADGTLASLGQQAVDKVAASGINGIELVDWHQGEGDVCGLATEAYYADRLNKLVNAWNTQLPGNPKILVGIIGDRNICGSLTTADQRDDVLDDVRAAQVQVVDQNQNAEFGAITYAIGTQDGVHFETQQQVDDYAHQKTNAIKNESFGGTITNPRMVSVVKTSPTTIEVEFDQPIGSGPFNAFTVVQNGVDIDPTNEIGSGNVVTLTLPVVVSSPCTVILAHGNSASQQTVPANVNDSSIVAVPFSETL